MKTRKRTTNFTGPLIAALLTGTAYAQQPVESGAGQICGTLKNFQGEIQIFDYTRTHLGDSTFGKKLHCGDWVSVEKGKAVVEHASGAGMLISENSFIQILDPQSGENPEHAHVALYRGEFLFQAGKGESRVVTPNAIGRVKGGGAFVVYSSSSEESQIVGLGGKATLENRFFSEKSMPAEFASMVSFTNPVERLIPEQGRPVNAKELNARLARLGVAESIQAAVEKSVKFASKVRMPVGLASTVRKTEEVIVTSPESISRPVAVATAHAPKPGRGAHRAPASIRKAIAEPDFHLGRVTQEESDRKKLIQALSMIRPEEE